MLSLVSATHCMSRTTHHPSGTPYLALAITMVVGANLFASRGPSLRQARDLLERQVVADDAIPRKAAWKAVTACFGLLARELPAGD